MNVKPPQLHAMLDPIAATLAASWGFAPKVELAGGHCSRVYANDSWVLKVPYRGEEASSGRAAAEALSEAGIGPQVLESDRATGALLMERLWPGTKLHESGCSEDECRRIVLGLLEKIARLDPTGLLPVGEFVNPLHPLAQELLGSAASAVFLHGDLHHENILLGPSGWVAIDPKGLAGDPAFELSAFIRNPVQCLAEVENLPEFLRLRIQTLAAETGLEARRIWGWAVLALGSGPHDGAWTQVQSALHSLELPRGG